MSSIELQKQLSPVLREGDLGQCERTVAAQLAALPYTPFHVILELAITTEPEAAAEWFDDFFRRQLARFPIAAGYTEMNGFCINPDLWFCDAFAYTRYGGHEDYDWLGDWQSEDSVRLVVEGLEPLQEVYAGDAFRDNRYSEAGELTDLMVVIKFQDLIRKAAPHMRELRFPLLATAHDYDFIYEVRGNA